MRKIWILLLLFFPAAASADMAKPPEITSVIHADMPYGEGTYSWMMISAYDASLWTDASAWSWDVPFALALRYRMHFSSEEIAKRSLSEMQHIEALTEKERNDYQQQLVKLCPAVKDGDVITALYLPHKRLTFYFNKQRTGQIDDDVFARRFLSIWLSEGTSAPSLRKALLSGRQDH